MKIIDIAQGTPEWHAWRATHFTASDAAAMLGKGKYMSRNALLEQKSTGITPDVTPQQQAIFDRGHAAEAAAREIAEEIIGDDLCPVIGEHDQISTLGASFDGITVLEDAIWEHKLINEKLRSATPETLEEHYKIQMDQQLLVSGAEKCLFMASDGTRDDCNWFWYTTSPERLAAIKAGWEQFNADLAEFQPREQEQTATATVTEDLPAVSVQVSGELSIVHNFDRFEESLKLFLDEVLVKDPQTDDDFATLEGQVKQLKKAEEALDAAEDQLLSQVETVDKAKRRKDMLHELTRKNRLMAEKLVKSQKQAIKLKIAQQGRKAVDDHIAKLNSDLDGLFQMPQIVTDFNSAMKNKRTISSLRDAADDEVARAKVEATEIANLIMTNSKVIFSAGHEFLFSDRQQLVLKDTDFVKLEVQNRIAHHKQEEQKRIEEERARIQEEERAKAQREAQQKAEAEEKARREEQEALARQQEHEQRAAAEREQHLAATARREAPEAEKPAQTKNEAPAASISHEEESVPEQITISRAEYEQLLEDRRLLEALRAAGVDNWEGWDHALDMLSAA